MRIPNLSTTENITETIRRMDERRMELEKKVSSGQKITLPEDDGMRMGRLIKMDTEKSTLTQYRRNASYATEYLNAGHLNLDKLREVSVRAQEIARVAGSGLNTSAMKTYGFEVDQLIEEALNRVNSSHRKRSLFGGNETTPSFQSSEVQLGKRFQKTLSFFDNYVGSSNPDGKRELSEGDEVWVNANGHEYVLKAKKSGFTTKDVADALAEAINNDVGDLPDVNRKFDALFPINEDFAISVRGSRESGLRNNDVKVTASTSEQGDLILVAGVDQDFDASAQHVTRFDLQFFFKDSVKKDLEDRIRALEAQFANDPDPRQREIYKGKSFDDLGLDLKKEVARDVFVANWPDVQKWKDFDDPVSLAKFDHTAHFPLLSQSTLDLIASSGSNMRFATDADVSLGVSIRVDDYMPSRFLSYSDAADMRLATDADVSLGSSIKVGDHIQATQADVVAGRAVIVGDYFAATSLDVGSRLVAKGDKLSSHFFAQATQEDVNAGRAATVGDYMRDATTLSVNVSLGASVKVGDHIQATLNDVTAGKAAKIGDYFPATQADVDAGTTLLVGDKRINEAGDYVPVRYFDQLTAEDKEKLGSAIFEEGWDRDLSSSASYSTTFGSDYYFPKPTQLKLDAAAASQFNGKTYQELTPTEKEKIAIQVFGGSWERDLSLSKSKVVGTSRATIHHPTDWKRLSAYQYGDLVNFEGKIWRSRIDANWNHKPDGMDPAIWEEVPSQYDVERDDWELTVSGTRTRDYWLSPDGKMFDRKEDAVERTRQIVIQTGYVQSYDELTSEIARLTKRVTYAVPQFSAMGSESGDALVSFDAQTQEHFLASPSDGGSVITGTLLQGEFTRDASSSGGLPGKASLEHQAGDIVFRQGRYYLARQAIAETDDRSSWEYLSQWEKDAVSEGYVPPNNLGDHDKDQTLEKGDHIFDAVKSQYYVATAEVEIKAGDDLAQTPELKAVSSGSDGNVRFLGETLPIQGNEKTFSKDRPLDILAGEYLHDPENNEYYIATQNFSLEPNLLSGAIIVSAAGHSGLTLKKGEHVLTKDHVAVQADVDLGLTIAIGDQIKVTSADLAAGRVTPADQYFVANGADAGSRRVKLGDQILATSANVGSRKVALGVQIQATQADVDKAQAADPTSTLQVGNYFSATQAEVAADRVTVVGDYFLATQAVLDELSRKVAVGDGIQATQADVDNAKVADPASTLQVGGYFSATQAEVDAGRIAAVDDQIRATVVDVGSRMVVTGDQIKATQADVTAGKAATIGDPFAATQAEVDAGRATVVGDYFKATGGDVGLPIAIGDKIQATQADVVAGRVTATGDYFDATGVDVGSRKVAIGDIIDKYYIATSDVTIPAGSDLAASLKAVVPSETFDPTTFDALESVSASFAEQGADWSPAFEYKKGQIVNYNGHYFQCLQDNWNNMALDPETMSDFVVVPSAESIPQLVQGSGEIKKVANYAWSSLEKPLGHVLKFSIEEEDTATVALPTAGRGGTTAKAKAMVDAYGKVVGMRVLDPGRYFSGVSSKGEMLPPDFDRAEVSFPDGQSVMVDVLWYRDFTDPGTWKVSGFDFGDQAMPDGIKSGPQTGDTYSFATGSKTFLEHRDENGSVVDVAYSGSTENSEFYIGHKSKISSFLEAKNKGTEELGDVVNSLVDLREALRNAKPSAYAAEVEAANQQLIALEERVVDKMGDLSAKMVRMETVKSHDEDYYMELDERVSRDLDLDLSEAIMRLMRASTAYQASLQVGAQLMNTSLLNYL